MRRESRLVEFELVQDKIEEIDMLIGEAENNLTWLSAGTFLDELNLPTS